MGVFPGRGCLPTAAHHKYFLPRWHLESATHTIIFLRVAKELQNMDCTQNHGAGNSTSCSPNNHLIILTIIFSSFNFFINFIILHKRKWCIGQCLCSSNCICWIIPPPQRKSENSCMPGHQQGLYRLFMYYQIIKLTPVILYSASHIMKERIKGCQWWFWHAEAVSLFCVSSARSGKCYSYSAQRWPFLLSECSGGGRGAVLSLLYLPRFLVPKQFECILAGSNTIRNSSVCSSHWPHRSIPVSAGCGNIEVWKFHCIGDPD